MTEVSLATPYTTEKIVESYNLFLNSDDVLNNGQNYDFQFGNNTIMTRNKDQFIRLTLLNFNMYKNWTDVNDSNNGLIFTQGGSSSDVRVPVSNYASIHDLATDFGDALASSMNALGLYGGVSLKTSATLPPSSAGIGGTTDNIISITLTTTNNHGITAGNITSGAFRLNAVIDSTNVAGSAVPNGADAGLLLGIDRLLSTSTAQSFNIDVSVAKEIKFTAKYPAQRNTEPNVYMRINPAPQIFASQAFEEPLTTGVGNKLNPANILAEIKIDTELVQYNPTSDREYFVNLYQNALSHFQIYLTDSRNRALPVTGTDQTTIGNRYFTATLRVDIVQDVAYGQTSIANVNVPKSNPARMDANLLRFIDEYRKRYGGSPGF